MADWVVQYWVELLFGGVITCLGFAYKALAKKFKEKAAEDEALKDGVQALLRDRIIQACDHYNERESVSIHGLENIENMYKAYHALGGNGAVTKMVGEIRNLPTDY